MPCGGWHERPSCKVSGFDASVSFDVRMRVLRLHACVERWSVRWPGTLSAIALSFVRTSTRRGSQRHLIVLAEGGASIVRETVPRRNAMAGGMTEAEMAANFLASGLIITFITVLAGVIVLLILCCVSCIRVFFRDERDIGAAVMQQGAHPDHFELQLRPLAKRGAVAARPPPHCQI
ncbi:uncharacterized protein LOC142774694 [Rhipicephalus microplus]|uniref:uncharacterized protein LOC142774694 n=1 Tax=Rhipicephalus microplus TaxID=6941 RepID=UPI003F6D48EF